MVFRHDGFLQFGGCANVLDELLVEVPEAVFELGAHRDSHLYVFILRLQDGDTIVDDGALFEQRALLACRVLGQQGFCTLESMRAAVDGTESYVSDSAGEGLNRLIRVESDSCHNYLKFKGLTSVNWKAWAALRV